MVGEKHPQAKLSEGQVLEIRYIAATTNMRQADIGKLFGVAKPTVQNIVGRITWKHL